MCESVPLIPRGPEWSPTVPAQNRFSNLREPSLPLTCKSRPERSGQSGRLPVGLPGGERRASAPLPRGPGGGEAWLSGAPAHSGSPVLGFSPLEPRAATAVATARRRRARPSRPLLSAVDPPPAMPLATASEPRRGLNLASAWSPARPGGRWRPGELRW